MASREEAVLARDCEAIQIPDGYAVLLPKGFKVMITQTLGGTFTVAGELGGLYRIDAKDGDALGREASTETAAHDDGVPLEEKVWAQLRQCYDPEIPVNIVDLGLIYGCSLEPHPESGQVAHIQMTLTAPGCGMGEVLAQDVKKRLEGLPGIHEARVEIVFDPPWNQAMMSDAAKLQLGFF
jgi:probable FeS assembly SUF system protein SufT